MERGAGARRSGGAACRHFALPLLYAERARHWPGGMMAGQCRAQRFAPAAGVTAARLGSGSGPGSGRGLAGSVTREGAALGEGGAARSRGAMPATAGGLATSSAAGRRHTSKARRLRGAQLPQ